jgi:RNase H-like domain found in reverse transcriptase/Reverse transcriptase (RNA-dependent DNA polymerase)/Integrase zinc binding domain/Chromo (CHRromatin Organisation MOdifier) domain
MIDSGATGNFIDDQVARDCGFAILKKEEPYRLTVIDGTDIESNEGQVTFETDLLVMKTLKGHSEEIKLDLVAMGTHKVILGMPWLKLHNPQIDWWKEQIIMNQCACGGNRSAPQRKKSSGQEELCATSQEPENPAQVSSLKKIPTEYKKYELLFQEGPRNEALPKHQPWDHTIPIEKGRIPTFGPIYQLSEKELAVLKDYIDVNLEKGFIRQSSSSCASPVIFVPKKNGKLRLCVDYRQLNSITIKDCYPLPLINELQDRIQGANWFTSLDLRGAYNLIRIKEGEEWKTAFRTRYGLFEYRVMPFGLTNAPASCQRLINDTLHEYLDIFVVAYLDDILIFSKTKNEHIEHVRKVLDKLSEKSLLLEPDKCEFHQEELEFVGFIIGRNGVKMSPRKIEAVRDWPRPTTVKEVQAFLGFANFYRRFIENYSKVAVPLTELTRKDQPFEWTKQAETAFEGLKARFITEPILAIFDPKQQIILETDASDFAIGACLGQIDEQGKLRPVAYYSRKLTPAELNYDVHDKELLAIVVAFKQWRVHLEGPTHTVKVWTDHKNLTTFTTTKILNRRQVRWSEELSAYNFTITYRKGSENARADALSRRQDYSGKPTERPRAILKEKNQGMEYNHELLATISVVENKELEEQIKNAYPSDECAQRNTKQPEKNFTVDRQGILRFKGLVYIPAPIRQEFVRQQHSLPAHGHQGIAKTLERLARDYYFPGMRKQVEKEVLECDLCNKSKASRHAPYGLLQTLPASDRAWKSIAFDFIVKLPSSKEPMTGTKYDAIWVVTDRLTKYGYFVPYMESSTAEDLAYAFLKVVISQHGLPEEIISDRDKLFTSKFWKSLMAQLGTNHKLSTAFHPQTDGQTERLNQTLEQYLRSYVNQQQDNWVQLLPMAQLAYNGAKSEPTGVSPFFANFGYEPQAYRQPRKDAQLAEQAIVTVDKLQGLHQELSTNIEFMNSRATMYANKKRSMGPSLQRGDKVYLIRKHIKTKRPSTKLDFKKLGPFRILDKVGSVNYRLELPATSRLHPVFHVSLLEPAKGDTPVATTEIQPENDEKEYEVEKILDMQNIEGQQQYLIKWKSYEAAHNTWEPTSNLSCPDLLRQFHQRHPDLPRTKATRARHTPSQHQRTPRRSW